MTQTLDPQKNSEVIECLRQKLMDWFDVHQRDLPWRVNSDPYAIWISEVMLQQTQVETVIGYYNRFLERFPTVQDLAQAQSGEVMKAWEGLGYYSRARNLQRAAQQIVEEYQGLLPRSRRELLALPGIGPYTAGAILSIAYGQCEPILDGNVTRVLTRVLHITDRIDQSETRKRLWTWAAHLVQGPQPERLNQSLMELGALICRPKAPQCHDCPLEDLCEARQLGIQELLPVKPPRKRIPHYQVTAGVIYNPEGRFLITLRPPKGLLGGLWEFPGGKQEPGETLEACLHREIREELEIDIQVQEKWMAIDHAYTHFRITLHVFKARYLRGSIVCHAADAYQWVTADVLNQFAFPAADQKILSFILSDST